MLVQGCKVRCSGEKASQENMQSGLCVKEVGRWGGHASLKGSNRGKQAPSQTEACQILIFKRSQICKFSCKISWVFIIGNQFSSHSWVLLWRVSPSPHRLKCDWDQRTWVWVPTVEFQFGSLFHLFLPTIMSSTDHHLSLITPCSCPGGWSPHLIATYVVHVLKYVELQFCATQVLCSA